MPDTVQHIANEDGIGTCGNSFWGRQTKSPARPSKRVPLHHRRRGSSASISSVAMAIVLRVVWYFILFHTGHFLLMIGPLGLSGLALETATDE